MMFMKRFGWIGGGLVVMAFLVGGCSKKLPTVEEGGGEFSGVLAFHAGKNETRVVEGIDVRSSALLWRHDVRIPVEVRMATDVPDGFRLISPVVRMRFHREAVAMDDPRVSSLLGMGVGIEIGLPVSGGGEDIRGLVRVKGQILGVAFGPGELRGGVAWIRIPVGLYFAMFHRDKTLTVEVFVAARDEGSQAPEQPQLDGFGIVESPGLTGIYVADRKNGWDFRWVPRLYQSIRIGNVTIPRTDLRAGLVRPVRLLLVHGFGVIYHNSGGWIGPDPDETWGDMMSYLTAGSPGWLRAVDVLAFNHSFMGVDHAVGDLQRAIRQVEQNFGAYGDNGITRYVLVGHSMGGLIVRDLYDPGQAAYNNVITLGSPLHGSFLADLVLQIAGQEFYVTQLAAYMANEVVQQCTPSQFQDPIQDFLQPYIQQLNNAKVALDGIFWVASRQGLMDLTYDWSEPLHFYVPVLGCFVSLDPQDPDFPAGLKRGDKVRSQNQRDQGAQGYLYVAFSDPYGSNDMFYNITSAVLASFHNDYETRVIPNVRHNDGLVWVRSARNDFGPANAILGRWSIPQARGNHTALRTVSATAQKIAQVVSSAVASWRQQFPGWVIGLGWGAYQSGPFDLLEWASGYFTKNLDLAVFRDIPGDGKPSFLPLVGYIQEGSVLPRDQWQTIYGGTHYGDIKEPGGPEWVHLATPQSGVYYIAVRKTHNGLTSPLFEPTLNERTVRVGIFGAQDTVIPGPSSWPSDHLWWVVAKITGTRVEVINTTAAETTLVDTIVTPGSDIPDTIVTRTLINWKDNGELVLTTQEHKTPYCPNNPKTGG